MVWKIQHRAVGREGLERGGKGLWTYRHVSSRWGSILPGRLLSENSVRSRRLSWATMKFRGT